MNVTRRNSVLLGGTLLAFSTSLAQLAVGAQANTAVENCARLRTPSEEIACLRKALQQDQPAAAPDTSASAAEAPAARATDYDSFGAEQLADARDRAERGEDDPEGFNATVTRARVDLRGRWLLELDNNQLWLETEHGLTPLRLDESRNYTVELRRSRFGGYRMRIVEMDRRITVKRVR
jgi:hypothetical protein